MKELSKETFKEAIERFDRETHHMTTEAKKLFEFIPGTTFIISRGTHAGWSITKRNTDPGWIGETSFFTDAEDLVKYLSACLLGTEL